MAFEGLDVLGIGALLTDEERLVQSEVRKYVESEVTPIVAACFEEGRFPAELIPSLAELGVLGANLPEEYGCAGMNNVAYGLVMQELEAGDSGIRSFASVQGALCMYPIFQFGSEDQKRKMAAANGRRKGHRMLRIDGAKSWLKSGRNADKSKESPRRLAAERLQGLDNKWYDGSHSGGLGQD